MVSEHDLDALPRIFRASNDAVRAAYQLGLDHGRRDGYREYGRDHHNWLLTHDERLAQVAKDAARLALKKLAEDQYRAGGPSMPAIWLELRANHPGSSEGAS